MRDQTTRRGVIPRDAGKCMNSGMPERDAGVIGMLPLMILAAIAVIVIATAGCTGTNSPAGTTTLPSSAIVPVSVEPTATAQLTPAPAPDPYPHALALGQKFPFGTGKVASEGTVYRYWINDTYQWLNNMDNHYYTAPDQPKPGYKYLFVFVQMTNNGETRVWFPPSSNIAVHYHGTTCLPDPSHYLPNKGEGEKETPVLIKEVQYFRKLNGDEYAEDFGFSHGTRPDFLYPGTSNSMDGYIIYVVPASLTPEQTYVEIPFNGQETGVWRLA